MKKLLCIFDGSHFSKGAINFATQLNNTEPILLTGIFLSSVDYSDVMMYYLGGMAAPFSISDIEKDENAIRDNIKHFETECTKNGIEYRVHWNQDVHAMDAIKKESRYADILIMSSELFYSNLGSGLQKDYLEETVHKAECPIVLVPENYAFPQSVIIAYDGSASSVFALKQFAYLFPQFAETQTLIVYASAKNEEIPEMPYLEELAARHFKDLSFMKLEAEPKEYFNTWITDEGNAMLVTGAFGRSTLSEMFRKNFADEVIKDHHLPVFIAHQ